jgi:hypothetical protein
MEQGHSMKMGELQRTRRTAFKHLKIASLRTILLTCVPLAMFPAAVPGQAVTIHVRLLNGRNGEKISGMDLTLVDYSRDRDGTIHADLDLNGRTTVTTTRDGDLYAATPDAHGVLVFGGVGNGGDWVPCSRQKLYDSATRTYGTEHLYSVSTIVLSGLVTTNSCSKKTFGAKPGQLVIFLRHSTWWERFIWGMES